jgi:nitrogen regulatory protein PII
MNTGLNLVKTEAVINPLQYDHVRCALIEAGIKRMKILEVIGVRKQNGYIQLDSKSNKHPFDFVPRIKFEIITDEDHSTNVVSAIFESAGAAQVSIEKVIVPTIDEGVKASIDKFLEKAANYSNH